MDSERKCMMCGDPLWKKQEKFYGCSHLVGCYNQWATVEQARDWKGEVSQRPRGWLYDTERVVSDNLGFP